MMHFDKPQKRQTPTNMQVQLSHSCFTGASGTEEHQFMLKPVKYGRFADQLKWLEQTTAEALELHGIQPNMVVIKRFFCSDLTNRIEELNANPFSNPQNSEHGVVSLVTQAPEPPAKVTLWIYCIKPANGALASMRDENSITLKRGELEHTWSTGYAYPERGGSYEQTKAIFENYNRLLESKGMSLDANCLRTWFFVKDVDTNYKGMVVARNEVFEKYQLTPDTHYIASTGIQGAHKDVQTLVLMDAYAIKGIRQEQIEYLQALDHLSHTHLYGVAFERATAISYADRKHILISGTASINHEGDVVHIGDVIHQLDRTLQNINALLNKAGATMNDMQQFIVYLRDPSDTGIIRDLLKERIGDQPFLIVNAPVCRPKWLIEIEGIAVIPHNDDSLPAF